MQSESRSVHPQGTVQALQPASKSAAPSQQRDPARPHARRPDATTSLSPAQRIRRWSIFLGFWRVHRLLGLSFGLLIVLLSLTGSLLVMHHELERALHPERHQVAAPPPGAARVPLVSVLEKLQPMAPLGFRPLRLEPGHDPTTSDKLIFVGPDRVTRWSALINPWNGVVLWHGPDQSLLTPWLLHLHMHLHAGKWGYPITGLAAVALIVLSLTGIWITRDRIAALLRHPLRLKGGARTTASALHKWIGLVSIYFTLVLGITGLWFAILIVPNQFRASARDPLASAFELAQLAAIEPAVADAMREFPGAEVARITFPIDQSARLQIRMLHRAAPVWEKFSRIEFDPVSGKAVRTARASEATTTQKWQAILAPLHFGFYGAAWVKWLYVIGGAMPALLAVTGTAVWWFRTRRSRPPPVD